MTAKEKRHKAMVRAFRECGGFEGAFEKPIVTEGQKMKPEIEINQVEVKIKEPKIEQITEESNPEIWAILQPPKN